MCWYVTCSGSEHLILCCKRSLLRPAYRTMSSMARLLEYLCPVQIRVPRMYCVFYQRLAWAGVQPSEHNVLHMQLDAVFVARSSLERLGLPDVQETVRNVIDHVEKLWRPGNTPARRACWTQWHFARSALRRSMSRLRSSPQKKGAHQLKDPKRRRVEGKRGVAKERLDPKGGRRRHERPLRARKWRPFRQSVHFYSDHLDSSGSLLAPRSAPSGVITWRAPVRP